MQFIIGDKVWWRSKPDFMSSETIEHGIIEYIHNNIMSILLDEKMSIGARKKLDKWFVFRINNNYLEELFKEEK